MIAVEYLGNRLSRFVSVMALMTFACIATDAAAQTRATITRDSDNPALAPFRFTVNTKNTSDTYGVFTFSLPPVPAGKRLVVQQLSYNGYSYSSLLSVQMRSAQMAGEDRLSVGVPSPVVGTGNFSFYSYTTPAIAYFDAGEIPVILFQTTNNNGTLVGLFFDVVVTGYYVTL